MTTGDLYVDPDGARAAAAQLAAAGADWRETWARGEAPIAAAEAANPWGDDAHGQQLAQRYNEAAMQLRPVGDSFGECYETLGDQVRTAVNSLQAADRPIRTRG